MAVKGLQVAVLLFRSESDKKDLVAEKGPLVAVKGPLVAVKGPEVAMLFARSGSEGLQGCGNTVSAVALVVPLPRKVSPPSPVPLRFVFVFVSISKRLSHLC